MTVCTSREVKNAHLIAYSACDFTLLQHVVHLSASARAGTSYYCVTLSVLGGCRGVFVTVCTPCELEVIVAYVIAYSACDFTLLQRVVHLILHWCIGRHRNCSFNTLCIRCFVYDIFLMAEAELF